MIKWTATVTLAVALAAACAHSQVALVPPSVPMSGVVEARISPDGRVVAFTRQLVKAETRSLLLIPFAGGVPELLLADGQPSQLRWAPDGQVIAFATAAEPRRLMVVAVDGGRARAATSVEETAFAAAANGGTADPTVAVVGAKVVHVEAVGTTGQSLTLTNGRETWIDLLTPATGARVTVMPPGIATILTAPSWSADGRRFVVVGATAEHGPEVFAGALPLPMPKSPDYVGAPPPQVRRLTVSNP